MTTSTLNLTPDDWAGLTVDALLTLPLDVPYVPLFVTLWANPADAPAGYVPQTCLTLLNPPATVGRI